MKCNNGYNGRIFNKKDEFITQGREYIFNCLWNDDVTWILGNVTRIPRHELPQTLDFSDFLPLFT